MGLATMDVSIELLADVLCLPEGTEILYPVIAPEPRCLRLVIDVPGVSGTAKGERLPHLTATFRRDQSPSTVTFTEWLGL